MPGIYNLDPTTSRFTLTNALAMAKVSLLAYKGKMFVGKVVTDNWRMSQFQFFDVQDTQCFVCANKELILLAFRGTKSIRDWITDAKAAFVSWRTFGKVHKGFHKALNYVWDDVITCIQDFHTNGQSVWLTGHSLGGALATLAFPQIVGLHMDVRGMYTFGQPRTGNKTFAARFDAKHRYRSFRVVNNEDLVTRIPPRLMTYRHIGRIYYFDDKGVLHRGIEWWRVVLNRWASVNRRATARYDELREQNPNGVADHFLENYIKNIKKAIREQRRMPTFLDHINN